MSRNETFGIPCIGPQTGAVESHGLTQGHFPDAGGRGCCHRGSWVPVILMRVNTWLCVPVARRQKTSQINHSSTPFPILIISRASVLMNKKGSWKVLTFLKLYKHIINPVPWRVTFLSLIVKILINHSFLKCGRESDPLGLWKLPPRSSGTIEEVILRSLPLDCSGIRIARSFRSLDSEYLSPNCMDYLGLNYVVLKNEQVLVCWFVNVGNHWFQEFLSIWGKQEDCFGEFSCSWFLLVVYLSLGYFGVTLRKTSWCDWELLGTCCHSDFIFL